MAKQADNVVSKGNTLPEQKEGLNGAKNDVKTTKKAGKGIPPKNPVKFDAKNQPSPEAKKLGWQKFREKRMLTTAIIDKLFDGDGKPKQTFNVMMDRLIELYYEGNKTAMDTVHNSIEDQISKIAITDADGNALPQIIINPIASKK